MKNIYIYHAHISEEKTRRLIKCFALDLTGTQTAELTGLNVNTIDRIFNKIRVRILEKSQVGFPNQGEFEVDEGYVDPHGVESCHNRSACGKDIVFGLFEREGKVYTEIVSDVKVKTLQAIIRGQADIESVIYTDGWRDYDGLVDFGYEKLFRVHHSDKEYLGRDSHIKGIEGFWGYMKRRLAKFKGIPNAKFELYLKETEFRFNAKGQNIYLILLKELRDNPLN